MPVFAERTLNVTLALPVPSPDEEGGGSHSCKHTGFCKTKIIIILALRVYQ